MYKRQVIFHEGDQTRRIELEQIFPKPDMEKRNKQHLPVLNPGVQLTVVYFLQELRKPNQRRDDAERMQHLRELEEEMLVNLMRSKFILAIDISQVQGEFDPANPGPDVRIQMCIRDRDAPLSGVTPHRPLLTL